MNALQNDENSKAKVRRSKRLALTDISNVQPTLGNDDRNAKKRKVSVSCRVLLVFAHVLIFSLERAVGQCAVRHHHQRG